MFTAEAIYAALLVVMALVFDLAPRVKVWWENVLPPEGKRWAWLLGSLVVPLAVYALKCLAGSNLFNVSWPCTVDGLLAAIALGVGAYWLSQGAHGVAKGTGRAL